MMNVFVEFKQRLLRKRVQVTIDRVLFIDAVAFNYLFNSLELLKCQLIEVCRNKLLVVWWCIERYVSRSIVKPVFFTYKFFAIGFLL